MNFNPRRISIALILIYLVCILFTAYTLFQLPDDMVYSSQALSVSDIMSAGSVIVKLYLIVGLTLLVGLAALVYLFKNRTEDVIYVEKKKTNKKSDGSGDEDDEDDGSQLSTAFMTDLLKSQKDEQKIFDKSLVEICKKLEAGTGVIYTYNKSKDKKLLEMKSAYALSLGESQTLSYELGEGLVGQAAKERNSLIVDDIPEGYIKIVSGLGNASPTHLLISPIEVGDELFGVIEIASFTALGKREEKFVQNCMNKVIEKIKPAEAPKKTTETKKSKENKDSDKGKAKKA